MATTTRQSQKEGTRQLGCRANKRDEILLTTAAKLDRRERNGFILLAATAKAREVLKANGIEEETLYTKILPAVRRRTQKVAA